jgi:oligoribonuclease NrnB/cAMP/cGMP phosphodiesterase (DHH superfamily)
MNPSDINIICYHSPCQDGTASAWVASKFAKENKLEYEYIPMSHSSKSNSFIQDVTGKNILFVDYAPTDELMKYMKDKVKGFYILDHHITNKQRLEGIENCVFDMNKSGVGLTWEYFYKGQEIPMFLGMIQDRDIWTFKLENTKSFCDGFYTYTSLTKSREELFQLYDNVYSNPLMEKEITELGCILNKKKMNKIKKLSLYISNKTYSFRNHKVCLFNCDNELTSDLGNYMVVNYDYDFTVCWSYDHIKEEYHLSLRSKGDMDVSAICKEYGGGGHKNAAGCSSTLHPSQLFSQPVQQIVNQPVQETVN